MLGLLAKPILDICLVVEEPADERTYVPMLRTIGYVLPLRESAWYEHRMLWHDYPDSRLYVFGPHCGQDYADAKSRQSLELGVWESLQLVSQGFELVGDGSYAGAWADKREC